MLENQTSHINYLIEMIENYDLMGSFDDLYNVVGNLLNGVPVAGTQLRVPYDIFNPADPEHMNSCFRVRKFKSLEALKSQIINNTHLWARPRHLVNDYGRCHSPNQEILYCSNNMIVGIAEVGSEVGDFCAVARFASRKCVDPLNIILLGDSRYKFESNQKYNPLNLKIDSQLDEENKKNY